MSVPIFEYLEKNRFVNESVLFALSRFMKFINIRELSTGTSLLFSGPIAALFRMTRVVARRKIRPAIFPCRADTSQSPALENKCQRPLAPSCRIPDDYVDFF